MAASAAAAGAAAAAPAAAAALARRAMRDVPLGRSAAAAICTCRMSTKRGPSLLLLAEPEMQLCVKRWATSPF
eukprot:COSAG04_NODE_28161_length_277_cov_0.876404_1_plen_72_part_10